MRQKPFLFVTVIFSCLAFLSGLAFAEPPKPAAKAKVAQTPAVPRVLGISVEPKSLSLEGPRAQQPVIVTAALSDTSLRDVTRDKNVTYLVADPKIAAVRSHGVVTPVGDGTTMLIIKYQNFKSQIPVKVKGAKANVPINFTTEVEPLLSKAGCNMGACHGAQYGKGGFKLSLLAYDTDLDYRALIRQSESRRVLRHDPANSLLLKKAVMAVPHGGGLRFDVDSWEYNVIKQWIEQGVQPPTEFDPEAVRLEVIPNERVLKGPGEEQQIIVRAIYNNGKSEDVTQKARFNSSEESVATVTGGVGYSGGQRGGLVRAVGRGETVIMVRYMGAVGVARIYVPYEFPVPKMEKYPTVNFIDELSAKKWAKLRATSNMSRERSKTMNAPAVGTSSKAMRRPNSNADRHTPDGPPTCTACVSRAPQSSRMRPMRVTRSSALAAYPLRSHAMKPDVKSRSVSPMVK